MHANLSGVGVLGGLDVGALATLALALMLVTSMRVGPAVWLLVAQSAVLTVMVGALALAGGEPHLWIASGLSLVVKVFLVPRILHAVVQHLRVRREREPVVPQRVVIVLAAGLCLLAYWVAGPAAGLGPLPSGQSLPVAIACMLLGGLIMVTRRKALMQLVGLLVMENGLYLAAMVATGGMPLLVELGVFFDLLVGALVMGIIMFRINQTFDTIDTDQLRRLRF